MNIKFNGLDQIVKDSSKLQREIFSENIKIFCNKETGNVWGVYYRNDALGENEYPSPSIISCGRIYGQKTYSQIELMIIDALEKERHNKRKLA